MMFPMLNVRKPRGHRGEAMVARMRLNGRGNGKVNGAPGRAVAPPSTVFVGQTGTVNAKRFTGAGSSRQPVRARPFLGGLEPVNFRSG